ncbi:hypothetical protein ACWGH2_29350 [Streptomyces sp. NPDC054871]
MTDHFSRFDRDPEALAWARAKVQAEIDRATKFVQQATAQGATGSASLWRHHALHLHRSFVGGQGCVHAAFDERLPALAKATDGAIPAPIDRSVRRDHSLCGAEPCSDCR